jgi:hypothetical protein
MDPAHPPPPAASHAPFESFASIGSIWSYLTAAPRAADDQPAQPPAAADGKAPAAALPRQPPAPGRAADLARGAVAEPASASAASSLSSPSRNRPHLSLLVPSPFPVSLQASKVKMKKKKKYGRTSLSNQPLSYF